MDRIRAYQVLGISHPSQKEVIHSAYRDLVQVWHPDRFGNNERLRRKAEERLKEINAAYDFLTAACEDKPAPRTHRYSHPRPRPSPFAKPSIHRLPSRDVFAQWCRRISTDHLLISTISFASVIAVFALLNLLTPRSTMDTLRGAGSTVTGSLNQYSSQQQSASPPGAPGQLTETSRPPQSARAHKEARGFVPSVSRSSFPRPGSNGPGSICIRNRTAEDAHVHLISRRGTSAIRVLKVSSRSEGRLEGIPIGRYYVRADSQTWSSGLLGPLDFIQIQSSKGLVADEYTILLDPSETAVSPFRQ